MTNNDQNPKFLHDDRLAHQLDLRALIAWIDNHAGGDVIQFKEQLDLAIRFFSTQDDENVSMQQFKWHMQTLYAASDLFQEIVYGSEESLSKYFPPFDQEVINGEGGEA